MKENKKYKLEDFIEENRTEFDAVEMPNVEHLWGQINASNLKGRDQTQQKKILKLRRWVWGLAASVVLLLGVGIHLMFENKVEETYDKIENPLALISADLAETEKTLKQEISLKEKELNINNINKELYKEVFEELSLLEEMHIEHQKDIPEFQHKEELIFTLMRYYEQKLRVLERLSKEIEKIKYHEERILEKPL